MAQYTPNFNLYEPDSSDDFADFRTEFNNNMDIIDQNLGGGGGSGGHTIIDENGQSMTQRTGLEFTGNVQVTDDSVNDKTIVDILGGGGNVYGAFVDTANIIIATSPFLTAYSYTATEDCFVCFYIVPKENDDVYIKIDGQNVASWWRGSALSDTASFYVRKGQTISVTNAHSSYNSYVWAYGLTQGTNGIFAPVIYSDNERVIGVWRDNKPLYQRTFDLGSDLSISYSAWVSSGVTLTNVENLITAYGTRSDYSFQGYVLAWNDNTDLKLTTPRNGNNSFIRYLTLQYTKTTDVAGSGNWNTDGVPTVHYSASEQVIGTWIDNKPLYERTYTGLSIALNNDNWVYFNDPVDIDNLVSFVAYYQGVNGLLHCAISEYQRSNTNGIMFAGYPNMNRTVNVIVARYTKTTD